MTVKISGASIFGLGPSQAIKAGQIIKDPRPQDPEQSTSSAQEEQQSAVLHSAALNSIRDYAGRAKEAVSRIAELRAEQYEYAKQAEKLAIGDSQLEYLDEKVQDLQSQIDEIAASTYKGYKLTGGATFGVPNENGAGRSLSLGDFSSVAANPNVSLLTPSAAEDAVDKLEGYVNSALIAASSAQAASNAADAPLTASTIKNNSTAGSGEAQNVTEALSRVQEASGQAAEKLGEPNLNAELVNNVLKGAYVPSPGRGRNLGKA